MGNVGKKDRDIQRKRETDRQKEKCRKKKIFWSTKKIANVLHFSVLGVLADMVLVNWHCLGTDVHSSDYCYQ